MNDSSHILTIKNLTVTIPTKHGPVTALKNINLNINRGEILAVVGESGAGKSLLGKSILQLLPKQSTTDGQILFANEDLTKLTERKLCLLRGRKLAFIMQNSQGALNPALSVAYQLHEAIKLQTASITTNERNQRCQELLTLVGLANLSERLNDYPHQFSGGQLQRLAIAMALAGNPQLLIADEPTTALDVTMQTQILDLMQQLRQKLAMAILLISHDLSAISRIADRVAVMYQGQIVEYGPIEAIFSSPIHAYTKSLISAIPLSNPTLERARQLITFKPTNALLAGSWQEITPGHFAITR